MVFFFPFHGLAGWLFHAGWLAVFFFMLAGWLFHAGWLAVFFLHAGWVAVWGVTVAGESQSLQKGKMWQNNFDV